MATGWLWEERYAWHDAGIWNDFATTPRKAYVQPERAFENPETKRRFRNLLDVTGVLDQLVQLRARPATDEEILRVHTPAHLARVRALGATGRRRRRRHARWAASATRSPLLAAGGAIVAADAVLDGTVDNAYALVRPPGHHAEPRARDGLLRVLEHRRRDPPRAAGARRRARRGRRLGRPPRQRHRDDLPLRSERAHDLAAPGRALPARPRARRTSSARARRAARTSTSRCRRAAASRPTAYAFERVVVPALRAFRPRAHHRRERLRRQRVRPARPHGSRTPTTTAR